MHVCRWLICLAVLLGCGVGVWGQLSTASLRGTALDPNGAVVPGVTVTIENAGTGVVERTLTTDDTGGYAADALSPGAYTISAKKDGFATQIHKIDIQVGRVVVVDIRLTLGSLEQSVTVSSAAPLVDRENSGIGGVVDPKSVSDLPLNGRQFGDLAALVPGVLTAPNFDPIKTRIFNLSAGGSDGRSSNFTIDGAENSDIVNGGLLQNFTIEGVQEFYVATARFGADQGRALGAAVSVVTKSGTNDLHGSYFVFYRNQDLNARDPFQTRKADFHRAQQGFTLGGPVLKNRTFFFAAYENTGEKNLGIVNTNGAYPEFEGSVGLPFTSRLATTRLDHQLNSKQKLMFRFNYENNFSLQGIGGIRAADNGIRSTNQAYSAVLSHTHVLSPRVLNTIMYHYAHFNNHLLPLSATPEVDRPSLITGGAFNTTQKTFIERHQLRDDLALNIPSSLGTHNIKLGVDYNHALAKSFLEFAARGQFIFFSDAPLTQTDADFAFFGVGNFQFPDYKDNILGLYGQDDWKVNQRLTLNLGLRWDLSTNENNPGFRSNIAPGGSRSKDLNNFGPRIGFAWDPVGHGKTIIRGGYGIFYALPVATDPAVESAFDGRRIGFAFLPGPININDPFPGLTQEQIRALVFSQPQFLLISLANHLRTPYAQQTSIGVQHAFTDTLGVTVDYVHNLGLKERLGIDVNIDPAGGIGSPDTPLAQEFGAVTAASYGPVIRVTDAGRSSYNALEMSVNKRLSHRLTFLGSYTWSHAVDLGDDSIGSTVANPFDLRSERGDSNRDQRHKFVFSGSVSMPHGFDLSTITSFASARPYDLVTGFSADGFAPNRPDGVTRNRGARDDAATIAAINVARASQGLSPITTTSPRSFFFYSTDLRLTKQFKIKERFRISALAEAFNIFNHVNYLSNGGPTFSGQSGAQNNVFAADFGKPRRTAGGVLGSGGPRAAQLGLRIEF
ncbi:MAG: TonB-dependent receptor [Acidobacteria bacterium]|nr:TonB-dependent receptor [Acidobacteriota bacterium]